MLTRWLMTLFAVIPLTAAMLVSQSCGGEGGPIGGNGNLPSVSEAFLALLTEEQRNADYVGSNTCAQAACHGGAGDESTIYEHWQMTKHADENVGCERCHGPGSAHAANPEAGNILKFPKVDSPVVCGQCHGPVSEQFNLSAHNLLISSPLQSAISNPASAKSSRCISCHSGIAKVLQENGTDIGTLSDQQIKDLANDTLTLVPHVANCSSCHNPHKQTGNLTDTGEEVQLRKQVFNADTGPIGPGQTAAVFTNFNHTCGQCHNGRGTNPADNALTSSTSRPSMHDSNQFNMLMGTGGVEGTGPVVRNTAHATAPGQCSKCHMPDSRHTFTVSYDKGCAPCHTAADAAARISVTRNDVIDELLVLRTRMENWAQAELGDFDFWDYTSLIQAEGKTPPAQNLVPIQVKRARHNYYFVIRSGDYGAHNAPYARHLINVAIENMDALNTDAPVNGRTRNMSTSDKLRILEADRKRASRVEIDDPGH